MKTRTISERHMRTWTDVRALIADPAAPAIVDTAEIGPDMELGASSWSLISAPIAEEIKTVRGITLRYRSWPLRRSVTSMALGSPRHLTAVLVTERIA